LSKNKSENKTNNKIKFKSNIISSKLNIKNKLMNKNKMMPLDWMQYFVMFSMHPFYKLACPRLVLDMNLNQAIVLGQIGQYYKGALAEEMNKCGINTHVLE